MMRTYIRFLCLALAGGFSLLVGCGSRSVSDESATCNGDTDCAANERCEPLPSSKLKAAVAPPCMYMPQSCSDDTICGADQVCWPSYRVPLPSGMPGCFFPPNVCAPKCPTTACYADEACEESGHCRITSCTEDGALACPSHWRCDPEAAAGELNTYSIGTLDDSQSYSRDIERGCARIRCDETGGLTCKENWSCDPENSSDPSGCVPLDCEETGHCSDDTNYICTPTSTATRPDRTDVHGCVVRLCDEGLDCGEARKCDLGNRNSNDQGCRYENCAETGQLCGTGYVCDPTAENASIYGCVYDPPATAGTGGQGSGGSGAGTGGSVAQGGSVARGGSSGGAGRSGSGGSNTSGAAGTNTSGTGGSDPDDEPEGRCVAR